MELETEGQEMARRGAGVFPSAPPAGGRTSAETSGLPVFSILIHLKTCVAFGSAVAGELNVDSSSGRRDPPRGGSVDSYRFKSIEWVTDAWASIGVKPGNGLAMNIKTDVPSSRQP